jgi:hypothetical protein
MMFFELILRRPPIRELETQQAYPVVNCIESFQGVVQYASLMETSVRAVAGSSDGATPQWPPMAKYYASVPSCKRDTDNSH